MKRREIIIAVIWILLGTTIATWSSTFPFGSRKGLGPAFLPFTLGLIIIFFGSILLISAILRKKEETFKPLIPKGVVLFRVASTLGCMLFAAVLLDVLGFILTIFCLTLLLFRAIEPQKWRVDLFYILVFTIGSYLLFQLLLKVQLPPGILGF